MDVWTARPDRRKRYWEIVKLVFGEDTTTILQTPNPDVQRRRDKDEQDRKELAERAATLAQQWVSEASLETHPYLESKGFQAIWGLLETVICLFPCATDEPER